MNKRVTVLSRIVLGNKGILSEGIRQLCLGGYFNYPSL